MSDEWNPAETIDGFARDLSDALGDDLRSVVLYGSVPRGEAVEGVSDLNVLVLVEDAAPARLEAAASCVKAWHESAGAMPLVFTPEEWRRSSDVYPIEVADMRSAHRVVTGDDPLAGMSVSLRHMRLQTERELRGKLVHLRGRFFAAGRSDALGRLLLAAAPSVATYLRTILRLQRRDVPPDTREVARAAARVVGGDPGPFLECWLARKVPDDFSADLDTVGGVAALMEAAARYVDTMEDR